MSFDENTLYNIKTSLPGTRCPLFDLAIWKNGLAFKKIDFSEDGVPVIKIAELNNGIGSNTSFTEGDYGEEVRLHQGDLLFSWSGNPQTSIDVYKYQLDDGWLNQHIFKVTANETMASKDFLFYLLKYLKPHFTQIATNKQTTGLGHVTIADLKRMSVVVPEKIIQDRIVAVVKTIDDKIEVNNEINKNLEQQAQALFISWFVDYTPFNGVKPGLWKNMSVYELAEYINGAAFKKNEYADKGLPIIKITELKNGITDATQYCCTEKDVKYYIDDRDILFSWSGNPDTSIDTFLWSNGKAILNQHTFRVVSKYNAPAFTFFLLKYLKPQFTHIASNKQTTGLGHVTVADLKRLQFCADENAIRDFNAITMPFFDMIFSNYKENQYLSSLRDTILPQLMSGELDVSEIDL